MQPDLLENLLFPLLAFLVAAQVHKIQRVLHDLAHAHTRVERGVRVLKDDLVLGAQSLEPILRDAHKLVALQPDGTARDAHQPHDSLGYGCLPEPLSPTMPDVVPLRTRNDTPSTAFT